jgi:hypothetical protein
MTTSSEPSATASQDLADAPLLDYLKSPVEGLTEAEIRERIAKLKHLETSPSALRAAATSSKPTKATAKKPRNAPTITELFSDLDEPS